MSWLLDTDVICQPAKRQGDARVIACLDGTFGARGSKCSTPSKSSGSCVVSPGSAVSVWLGTDTRLFQRNIREAIALHIDAASEA